MVTRKNVLNTEEFASRTLPLFASLTDNSINIALVASAWCARYGVDPSAAVAELYTLIAKVCQVPPKLVCLIHELARRVHL